MLSQLSGPVSETPVILVSVTSAKSRQNSSKVQNPKPQALQPRMLLGTVNEILLARAPRDRGLRTTRPA